MDFNLLIITLVLIAAALAYFRLANHFSIVDKPNQRSSHSESIIRGGGIIFPLALLLYYLFFGRKEDALYGYLLLAVLAISFVSFWDDIKSLPNSLRIAVHLLSVFILLYTTGAIGIWPAWLIIAGFVIIIGTINAYNFMDGINGITGVYSLVIFSSCLFYNIEMQAFADSNYMITGILACLVFLFFNFRKRARCFAGDVGSVGLGLWVVSLLLLLIIHTGEFKFIFFLAVYGVDTVLTIGHRLLLRQNIFEAHRLHFYQILVNERKISHRVVALIYGTLQLVINAGILFSSLSFWETGLWVCVPLAIIYIYVKPKLMHAG